jgi:FixJ family two-component response regulator
MALVRMLGAYPLDVRAFDSAQSFIDSLPEQMPECLILDVQMPGMNGIELQHLLLRSGIRIPTIAITGYDEEAIERQCLSAGAAAFMVKPLDRTRLVMTIHRAIEAAQVTPADSPE